MNTTKQVERGRASKQEAPEQVLRGFYFPEHGVTIKAENLEAATEKIKQTFNQ